MKASEMRHIGLQVRQKNLWRFTSASPSASGSSRLAASSRPFIAWLGYLRGWFGQQQQRTAQQQDYKVKREMDVRMVEIGMRGHLSNQCFLHSYLALPRLIIGNLRSSFS